MTEFVKNKKSCVFWKMFEMEFKFSKFSPIRSNTLFLGVSQPTKRSATQSTAYILRNLQDKQSFFKENEKKERKNVKKKSKSVKSLRHMDEFFFPTNDFSLLESCQLYLIAKYKASNCCKIEAVIQRCSAKKFLKLLPVPDLQV